MKSKEQKKSKEWIKPVAIVSLSAIVLIGAIAGSLLWMAGPSRPSSKKPEDVAKFIASDSFDKLPLAKKEEYLSKMPQGPEARTAFENMDEKTRRQFFENSREVREAQMNKKMRDYFSVSADQRAKWLDDFIAAEDKRMEEMRSRMGDRRPPQDNKAASGGGQQQAGPQGQQQGGTRKGGDDAARTARMKQRMESTPPEQHAMRMQFMADVMARRAETGKTMARPQGGGR